jgi:hypothetical protein
VRFRLAVLAIFALLVCLSVSACGGGGDGGSGSGEDSSDAVIDGWAKTLSAGDAEGAAGYFAVPSVVANGTAPVTLRSHADVVTFNRSLPCGAKLVSTRKQGRFIAATFRLTERPGGSCGTGAGETASTAFVISDGKIVQWRRLPNPPGSGGGGAGGPIV